MISVKICGITRPQDAVAAVQAGARAIGFVFYGLSPRAVSPAQARECAKAVPADVKKVGVFVNAKREAIEDIGKRVGLDFYQLHGDESPQDCMGLTRKVLKAMRIVTARDIEKLALYREKVQAFVIEGNVPKGTFGGSGVLADWTLARKAKEYGRVILAGGLNAANVIPALRQVQPDGLDVTSSVESAPGAKDPRKLKAFFDAIRRFEDEDHEMRRRLKEQMRVDTTPARGAIPPDEVLEFGDLPPPTPPTTGQSGRRPGGGPGGAGPDTGRFEPT